MGDLCDNVGLVLVYMSINVYCWKKWERLQDGTAMVGTVVVRNECYKKGVFVRHTSNAWQMYEDTLAEWMETLEGGTR